MITYKLNGKWTSTSFLIGYLMLMAGLVVTLVLTSSGIINENRTMMKRESITPAIKSKTFQELGFFGQIKEDKWDDFIKAVQKNIVNSRKEAGNLSFSLFQPENGNLEPIWFERFKDKEAHHYHKEQHYFKDAITVIQKSLAGEARSIELIEIDELPVVVPTLHEHPEKTRQVIVLFEVRPDKRQSLINLAGGAMERVRKTKGNLEYNIYQYADNPNKFVLMERWDSVANHEAQLKLAPIKQLNAAIKTLLVPEPMDNLWKVKDISQ